MVEPGLAYDVDYGGMTNDDSYAVRLAAATLELKLHSRMSLACGLDNQSVYGAAIALPQIARSGKWPRTLTALALRSYLFLVVTITLQVFLLYMVNKSESVLDYYGGQMNLCDFGRCLYQNGCLGPTGTEYTPERMYSWNAFILRTYFRDSLLQLFPEKAEDINREIDPGEYGLEDYWCRLACCFVFMVAVTEELVAIIRISRLMMKIPSKEEPWIKYVRPGESTQQPANDWIHRQESSPDLQKFSTVTSSSNPQYTTVSEEHVQVQIAGMSIQWKAFNICFVLFPKIIVWRVTAEAGITFLMETADITDTIVNAAALSVILSLEEMIHKSMSTRAAKYLMSKVGSIPWQDDEDDTEEGVLSRFQARFDGGCPGLHEILEWLPIKLSGVVFCTFIFVASYYHRRCDMTPMGFVSKPVHAPTSTRYNLLNSLLPNFIAATEFEEEPFWTMPKPT